MPEGLPIVMIWRRVEDLHRARGVANTALGLPVIGEDSYSMILDGGGALVGLWQQDEKAMLADDACSALNFSRFPLVSNPASEMVFVPRDMRSALDRLGDLPNVFFTTPAERSDGTSVTFFDDAGNMATFVEPNAARIASGVGDMLRDVLGTRGVRGEAPQGAAAHAGLLGHSLLSGNVERSVSFYRDTLGLRLLDATAGSADFAAGNVILTIRAEPADGLVGKLRSAGRLMGDWVVFGTDGIQREVERLARLGVEFPQGVESWGGGQMAYFQDPDGHSLVLWQPSRQTTRGAPIDFYPALDRIEQEIRQRSG